MNDLYQKTISNKEKLFAWLKERKHAKTSEVVYEWGERNFCNDPNRVARLLAAEGKIRRMDDTKKERYFGNIKEDVWEVIQWPYSCL